MEKEEEEEVKNERVVLNVGGCIYETFTSTLTKYPQTLLGTMFSSRNAHLRKPDKNNQYFFDRNGAVFAVILDFYRTGKIFVPPSQNEDLIRAEIEYFQLPVSLDDVKHKTLGAKIREVSVIKAQSKHQQLLEEVLRTIIETLELAAQDGCKLVDIDILKTASYKRHSDNKIQDNVCCKNIVNKPLVEFLHVADNKWLFEQRLKQLGFDFNLETIQQDHNFTIRFFLWMSPNKLSNGM